MTAIVLNIFDPANIFPETPGASDLAARTSHIEKKILSDVTSASTRWDRETTTINSLLKLRDECSEEDWDGYGALPIEALSFDKAFNFVKSLDRSIPSPEVCPEPDGEIAIEWSGPKGAAISISIGKSNIINYAAIFPDENKANGTESLNAKDKGTIESYIKRVLSK